MINTKNCRKNLFNFPICLGQSKCGTGLKVGLSVQQFLELTLHIFLLFEFFTFSHLRPVFHLFDVPLNFLFRSEQICHHLLSWVLIIRVSRGNELEIINQKYLKWRHLVTSVGTTRGQVIMRIAVVCCC